MQQHSGEMDFDEPGEAVWKNIADKTKNPKQKGKIVTFVGFAAAACFIVLIGSVWLFTTRNKDQVKNQFALSLEVRKPAQAIIENQQPAKEVAVASVTNETAEKKGGATFSRKQASVVKRAQPDVYESQPKGVSLLQNIETNFSQLVNIQLHKVRSLPLYAEGPEYYSEFKKQFQQLEQDEKELKKDIQKTGLRNENLENLIKVCQQKLNLLKLLQNEINKTNSRYKQNNQSDTATQTNHINI